MFPWHHRWTVLAFTLLSQAMVIGIHSFSFPFWVVPWLDEFQVPRSQLMLIITVSLLASSLIASFCGIALDKYGAHWVMSIGSIVFAAGLLLISMADSHWEILLLYSTLLPFGLMMCGHLGCQALIARWFNSKRGAALGISALGVSLGGLVMPPIATAMLAALGWRETFQLLAGVSLILIPIAWIVLSKKPEVEASVSPGGTARPVEQASWSTAKLLRSQDFWIVVVCFGAMMLALLPVLYSTGIYARDLGITQQRAALIASAGAFALGAGKYMFGRLADRIEIDTLYWFASAGMVVSIIGFSIADTWLPLMATTVVMSFCFGAYMPLLSVTVVNRFGSASFGRVLGLVLTFTQLGAIAPFISGLLREATGSYMVAFLVMMSPLVLGMFVMRLLSTRTVTT